jgi:hypothetical protein
MAEMEPPGLQWFEFISLFVKLTSQDRFGLIFRGAGYNEGYNGYNEHLLTDRGLLSKPACLLLGFGFIVQIWL